MWLLVAITAHFLNSIVFLMDKFLLQQESFPKPIVYAFYSGIFSIFALIFIPFGFSLPPYNLMILSLFAGMIFVLATILFFSALKAGETSRVVTLTGAFVPIFTLFLAQIIVRERLNLLEIIGFGLLVIGGTFISFKIEHFHNGKVFFNTIALAILAAFFFALSFTVTKFTFGELSFVNGFVWRSLGSILAAIFIFLFLPARRLILSSVPNLAKEMKIRRLFIFKQALGGVTYLLINIAIFLGSVSLVNSLQGVQYGFLFLMTLSLSKKLPLSMREETRGLNIIQKIIAILFIFTGLFVIGFQT